MWNNQPNGGYFPTPQPPSGGPGFPSANPYGPPPGPPPPAINGGSYPGAPSPSYIERSPGGGQHHRHHGHQALNPGGFAGGGIPSPYAPPSGPPPGWANSGSYAPPSGPPPPDRWGPNNGVPWQPPSGPPPDMGPQPFAYLPPSGAPHLPPQQAQYYGPTRGSDQQQPNFMYSQCTGRKKALLVGINYFGSENQLSGCINDATNMKQFIQKHYGYQEDDTVMLTDDRSRRPEEQPTRDNMIRAMQWLVRNAQPNDSLFFHYSGHGGLTKDLDGDEESGYDEVIYPVDFQDAGHIVDDDMHDIMVKPLPPGCRLTAVLDSCHSGSALDLPYVYSTEGKIKEPNLVAEAGSSLMGAVSSYARHDFGGVFKNVTGLAHLAMGQQAKAEEITRRTKSSPADVISWSGCKDSQTSADTEMNGQGTGAMSWAFMTSLNRNPQQSYQQLLVSIRALLRSQYSQRPQLSSSHPMDTNILFII